MGGKRLEWSVLRWNEASIGFYESEGIGARRMEEWVGMRVEDDDDDDEGGDEEGDGKGEGYNRGKRLERLAGEGRGVEGGNT